MTNPTAETVRLIREGWIDADQQCRYYRYLSHRLHLLSEVLAIVIVVSSLAALFTILSPLPRWVPLTALGITIAANIATTVRRYQHKSVYCADLYRQLMPLQSEWQNLFSDISRHDDAELREAWRSLSRRQRSSLLYSSFYLPLSERLMRLCRQEAEQYCFPQLEVDSHGNATALALAEQTGHCHAPDGSAVALSSCQLHPATPVRRPSPARHKT